MEQIPLPGSAKDQGPALTEVPPPPLSTQDVEKDINNSLSSLRSQHSSDIYFKPSPFLLRWIHGYNQKVGMYNLNDGTNTVLFYAGVNCGILYDWTKNTMKILQGHRHMIKSISADVTGKWLVTADSGSENIVTIWNSETTFPQRTIFSPHGSTKLSRVAISADAKFLLTLAYSEWAILNWWIWTNGQERPDATLTVNIYRDSVLAMEFNPDDSHQFLLLTKTDIWIGCTSKIFVMEHGVLKETDDYQLQIRVPQRREVIDHGKLTCFTFVSRTNQILVASGRGMALVFGYTINYVRDVPQKQHHIDRLRYIKAFKLQAHKINVIKSVDTVIVTGDSFGEIRFYDDQLQLLYWIHGFQPDCVKHMSFNLNPRQYDFIEKPKCKLKWSRPDACECFNKPIQKDGEVNVEQYYKDKLAGACTVHKKPFVVRNFILCTQNQGIWFVDFTSETYKVIVDCKTSFATALSVNAERNIVCIGYTSGVIELFNYVTRRMTTRVDLRSHYKVVTPPCPDSASHCSYKIFVPILTVTCLQYSPSGFHLACGLNTGEILFLDPVTIDVLPNKKCHNTNHPIRKFNYSPDSITLVSADSERTVLVHQYNCEDCNWHFIAKYRTHYKKVSSIFFVPKKQANGSYKLLSLGEDRLMNEYDVGASKKEELHIVSVDRIDQTAVPLDGIPWPNPDDLDGNVYRTDLPLILVANDEHKYKIVNYETTVTLSTVLGPRYAHPVSKLLLVTDSASPNHQKYLLFLCKNVVGLQRMPLDGNPWNHVGVLAHPSEVLRMCFREDSGVLFTIGERDSCMMQWAANYQAVEDSYAKSGPNLDPYYCLIDGGRPGWLFQEIRDLFYYIQILCQGTFSPAVRKVKDVIPIDSLPDLMRALGFFPSEYEVENLITEAKFKTYQPHPSAEIDFEEFVKLYINHRPAFGETVTKLRHAFKNFAHFKGESFVIPRDEFIDMLANEGERFPKELSCYLLSILNGLNFEERSNMSNEDFSFLPEEVEFLDFLHSIIGLPEANLSSVHSAVDSLAPSSMTTLTSDTSTSRSTRA